MTTRRQTVLLALAAGWIAAASRSAQAAERAAWSDAAFDAARQAGRSVIVEVTAPWCPTCRAQRPHVDATLAAPDMAQALLLTVDFDSQKDALRRLGVRSQSTLIAFKGMEERGRATGITDPAQIRDLLRRAL
jgi:thiol:disulfide interchange protein